jgi:hypothetical protein
MDWDQPHWSGKTQKTAPARQRLRPNGFAKLARFCVANRFAVLIFYLSAMILCAAAASLFLKVDPEAAPGVTLDDQTLSVQAEVGKRFPGIDNSFLAIVESRDADTSRNQALAVAASLSERSDLFDAAFVPGTGGFYDANALLFRDAAEVRARVDAALQMQPLYQALAASPDILGLARLVAEIGRAVEQGRSPPGLEAMLFAVAGAIESEVRGSPRPVDWPALAGLGGETRSQRWFVMANPRAGLEREAAEFAAVTTDGTQGVIWLWPRRTLGAVSNPLRDFAVPAGLAAFVTLTLLAAGVGSLRFSLAIALCCAVTLSVAAATAAAIGQALDGATWAFAAAVLAPAVVSGCVIVISYQQSRARGSASMQSAMLAAQRRGGLISAFAFLFCAFWAAWIVRQLPSLSHFGMIAVVGAVTAWVTAVTLLPAVIALFDRADPPADPHWFDEALSGGTSNHARNAFDILAMIVLAAAVFSAVFLPAVRFGERHVSSHAGPLLETPDARGAVHLVVPEGAVRDVVSELARLPDVGAIRTIGQFMPADVEEKIRELRRLDGFAPVEPPPGTPPDGETVRNSFAELERQLTAIATGPAASAGLRDAALRLRRAVSLYADAAPPTADRVLGLQQLLFAGLSNLSRLAARLATVDPPRLEDLEPALLRRFVSPDGLWRIEVMPKPGTGFLTFGASMRRAFPAAAGEPVAALARNEIIHHETLLALATAAVVTAILMLAALRNLPGWVVSQVPVAAFVTLTAAVAMQLEISFNTAMLAAASAVTALLACSSMIAAQHLMNAPPGGLPQGVAIRTALLPLAVLAGAVAPLALSTRPAVAELGGILAVMLVMAAALCLLLVPAVARWLKALGL